MSSTKVLGANVMMFTYDSTTDEYQPFVCARDITFNITTDEIETSVSGSGANRTFLPIANSSTVSIGGVTSVNKDAQLDIAYFQAMQLNREVKDSYIRYTAENGRVYEVSFSCFITSSSIESAFDGVSTFSVEFRVSGEIILSEES